MSVVTLEDRELLVIVEDGAEEADWLEARAAGVTASEVHDIAQGSRKTWRSILDKKLNGDTWGGNEYTRRGQEREPFIIEQAARLDGVVTLVGRHALFAHPEQILHRATPDGLGIHAQLGDFGAEVKWLLEDIDRIPRDHFDQMQWGMYVLGLSWWLYAWEVDGRDGIQHEWVPRDDRRIEQLVRQADSFIEWRAAGAPEIDDIPDDVDDALADYERGLALEADGKRLKTAARPILDAFAAKLGAAPGDPLRKTGSRASLFVEPKPDVMVLDEDAWAAAEPDGYAEFCALRDRVAAAAALAVTLYGRPKAAAATFRVTPNGDPK